MLGLVGNSRGNTLGLGGEEAATEMNEIQAG